MKKAIIYYSKTGNTDSVVKQFKGFKSLKVEASSDDPNQKNPDLTNKPDVSPYHHLVFASPVHGFQLAKIMKVYLESLDSLKDKTIDIFVTHALRFSWLGGNQALKQMTKIINSKGGEVRYKKSVNWNSKKRENTIETLLDEFDKSETSKK